MSSSRDLILELDKNLKKLRKLATPEQYDQMADLSESLKDQISSIYLKNTSITDENKNAVISIIHNAKPKLPALVGATINMLPTGEIKVPEENMKKLLEANFILVDIEIRFNKVAAVLQGKETKEALAELPNRGRPTARMFEFSSHHVDYSANKPMSDINRSAEAAIQSVKKAEAKRVKAEAGVAHNTTSTQLDTEIPQKPRKR